MGAITASAGRPVLYLTAIEDVAQSPLVRSQVLALLAAMTVQEGAPALGLVALYPVGNWWRFRHNLTTLRDELKAQGIALHVLPLFFLTRFFYISRWLLPIYWAQAFVAALWISLRWRPAVVHCRSYPAAVAGLWVKRLCGARMVFDTRALYPEEGATLKEGGKSRLLDEASFQTWKRIERDLVHAAEATAVVSQPSVEILAEQYPAIRGRLLVAPTCTHVPERGELAAWRQETRREMGIADDQLTVAYAGSWFEAGPTVDLFRLFTQALPGARWHFLMLVSGRAAGDRDDAARRLSEAVRQGLNKEVTCTAMAARQERVLRYLAGADLAAQPIGVAKALQHDPRYLLTARTRISIKFTEYLACGLPVFVSQWAGAAAAIVEAEGLGVVYDRAGTVEAARWLARWLAQREAIQVRTWEYARTHFATDALAARYLELYRCLGGPQ